MIKQGYHARERLYAVTNWGMNDHARMAYIAGDREEARKVFVRLAGRADLGYWDKDRALFDRAVAWANQN